MNPVDFLYEAVGILAVLGGWLGVVGRSREKKVRNAVALERNTEATERLTSTVEKLSDIVLNQDKRLDRVEFKLWPV